MELPDPPEGWHLKSLSEDDGVWKAFLYSSSEYVCSGGSSPRYAMLDALDRIASGAVHLKLSGGKITSALSAEDIVGILNIQAKPFVKRV